MELQSKLNQPRVSGCRDTSKVDGSNTSIWIAKIGVVEDVEELRSEFNDLVLAYPRALHHREVEDDVARAVEHIPTEAAETARTSRN